MKATVELGQYPMLVTFSDLKDPKTVKKVLEIESDGRYPPTYTVTADHFEELFGEGVKLKDITIEMTDEPVTYEVIKWLPWLPKYYNKMLDGERYNRLGAANPLANSLSAGSFSDKE